MWQCFGTWTILYCLNVWGYIVGLLCERPLWCPMWNPVLTKLQIWMTDGGSIIFWPCACWIFKKNLGEILVCHLGGQSSFDHVHVESLKKILGEILVCHLGGQSSFDHVHVESLKKNSRWDTGLSVGGSIIFWPCAYWIFKKILGEILVCHLGGQSSFAHVHIESLKNSRWDPGLSSGGGLSSFDHEHVESLKKILGDILVCHPRGCVIIFWPCACWIFKKNLGDILVCHPGGSIIFWPCACSILTLKKVWQTRISPRFFFKDSTCAWSKDDWPPLMTDQDLT